MIPPPSIPRRVHPPPPGPFPPYFNPRDIAYFLAPLLVGKFNGFLVGRGCRRFTGPTAEALKFYLQGAVYDALTKPHEPPVVDVVAKVVKPPRSSSRA